MAGYALPIGGSLTFTARQDRQARAALLQPGASGLQVAPGVRPGPGLDVSVAGSTITVTAGTAVVQSAASATAGAYWAWLDASTTLTLTAADGSNPRSDLVYLRVRDTDEDGSGSRDCAPIYLAGTPAASPSTPTIPVGTSGVILGVISVPKSGSGSPTVSTTTRQLAVAAGGILPTSSTAALAAAGSYVGQARYNVVRGMPEYWSGSAWSAQGDWTAWTPTWSGVTTMGAATATGRWTRIGTTIHMTASLTWGTGMVFGSGALKCSYPAAPTSTGTNLGWNGWGRYFAAGDFFRGLVAEMATGAATISVYAPTSDGSWREVGTQYTNFVAAGSFLRIHLSYEAAS
ncbi:hypothetical protein [Kitasatospora phosalacinea]|uniref:Minor tail protein n=1 Tax=Kitasatospora phosalacinea TaxID=2065 RepID=A0ABW6GRI6_9ACTN